MVIGKPIRYILTGMIAGAATGVSFAFLYHHIGLWAIIPTGFLMLIYYGILGLLLDILDSWLRRVTQDPIWVMQHEEMPGHRKGN